MAKKMSPLLPLLGLGAVAALVFSSKASAEVPASTPTLPASSAPPGSASTTVTKNGHVWKLVPTKTQTDVYAPAGSWGPHGELRVLRYETKSKVLTGAAEGVPKPVMDAAVADLGIKMPKGPASSATPRAMPTALQNETIQAMNECSARPPTAAGVQHATELSSRLAASGFPNEAAAVRACAVEAAKFVPLVPPAVTMPGVPPEIQAAVARAMQLERDPAKLEALKQSLKTLPPSAERDMLIDAIDAMILQIRTAQAVSTAAVEIDQAVRPASTGTRNLSSGMKGEDVRAWQAELIRSGYSKVKADGVFGPVTLASTKDWQSKRGLKPDGIVGPATRAKIGTNVAARPAVVLPTTSSAGSPRNLALTTPYMSGSDVKLWQGVLASSGYVVKSDGVFGPATSAATKDWQSKRNLKADGVVGPATRAKIGTPPTAPVSVPATASPRPDPKPKSSRELAADAMVTHLLALQKKWGVVGSKGKQDLMIVKRFQTAVGGVADGLPGMNTMIAAAQSGQGRLPRVMYWPKNATKSGTLVEYRKKLAEVANAASRAGMNDLASAILASAAVEDGSGMLK
jgi:peptidoglycan hydrolase-like protein with peptidoglycan-binding domain